MDAPKRPTDVKGTVLLLGAGLVVKPFIDYMSKAGYEVVVGSRTLSTAVARCKDAKNAVPIKLDITTDEGKATLEAWAPKVSVILSLLPYIYHPEVAEFALKYNKHFMTTSYESEKMRALGAKAKAQGLVFINECGVDPGTDHMSAMRIIDGVRARGGKITSFTSYCGGLPAPDSDDNPLGYKFSWAPRGVLLASRNTAHFLKDGKDETIPGEVLFDNFQVFDVPGAGKFEGYPNRNSKQYISIYGIDKTETIVRGTFRNLGWCQQIKKFVDLGFLNMEEDASIAGSTLVSLLGRLAGAAGAAGDALKKAIADKLKIDVSHKAISTLEWLGFFSEEKIGKDVNTCLDALCGQMLKKMQYKEGERDRLVMHHIFKASFPDGSEEQWTSTLHDFGIAGGDTSMSRTVSLPVAIACRLVLEGKFKKPGLSIPIVPELYNPILDELEKDFDIKFVEKCTKLEK